MKCWNSIPLKINYQNLSDDILDMEIVDEVVISADEDSENQFTFDFALTNKNQNEIDVEKVIDKLDNIENPDEDKTINEAMDFKFEIDEKFEKSELLDLSIENENLKPESPFDKSIKESLTSENEKRKEHQDRIIFEQRSSKFLNLKLRMMAKVG